MLWQPRGLIQTGRNWRRPQTTAAGSTTVFSATLGTASNGWDGFTFAQFFAAANLGAATGTQVRLTLKFGSLSSGETCVLYFGQSANSVQPVFTGTQVHMLFSGIDIVGNGSTVDYVSDWITLGEAYDEAVDYWAASQFTGGATANNLRGTTSGNNNMYKAGADAATTNKSGYSADTAGTTLLTTTIEIQ